ncbi:MAG: type I DNA topoisomerase [Sandaracinaceae bacterium]
MSKQSLVIVESPAKARTIAGYLGDGFVVESSIGHIRDLPRRASDVPAEYKKSSWARLGVDVDNDFRPLYIIDPDKKQHIGKLKKLLKESDELFLATDEDREGESIAWHLLEVLEPRVPVKRMVFHEITKTAIKKAIDNPRDIDRRLVDAQEARRILDRLYGYEVSPVLWKKVMPRLSAGRVQSVATRIVVERERARIRFRAAKYWDLEATLAKQDGAELTARLTGLDGKRLATGKDFGEDGKLTRDVAVLDEAGARQLAKALETGAFDVKSVERKPYRRSPAAPFMTSTLQQEASRKLRFGAQRAMRAAQRLYENGFITYMRTDSTTLSEAAVSAARRQITELYGAEYVTPAPRTYANKVKNAQEAHEAIRPAGDRWKMPAEVAREVGGDEAALYELIWTRTVSCQMEDARGETLSVRIEGRAAGRVAELSVSGRTISFPGFLRAYVESSDDPDAELENREKHLPPLKEGEKLNPKGMAPEGHETQPPARFTEASLVRALEELGVGRPSTYASIMGTIVDRGYVWKKGSALVPSFTAFAVVTLLEKHFPQLVDYAFTAKMEDELDEIAAGHESSVPWLKRFYLGANGHAKANGTGQLGLGLKEMVSDRLSEIDAREINSLPIGDDENGELVVLRVGRFGPYLERGEDRASVPEDMPPDELTLEKAVEILAAPSGDRELGKDPETGEPVLARAGRFGPYVQLGEASGDRKERPKTSSLFKTMSLDTITLEQALRLLSLPREIGKNDDGEPILALNGRYGPYIQHVKETRSLENEEQIFTVTVEEAKKLLAAPKVRGRRQAAAPLRTLGPDAVSQAEITVKEGRFGPYVTDGETNASLRKGDTVEGITVERASELLAERRARGPSKGKKGKKKAGAKKAAKKAPAKKAAKKAGAKKKATKKSAKKSAKKSTESDAPAEASEPKAKKPASASVETDSPSP